MPITATILALVTCAMSVADDKIQEPESPESTPAEQISQMLTIAESSDWQATSTHAQVMEFCQQLTANSKLVNMVEVGKTMEDRSLPILILADPPVQTPDQVGDRLVAFAWAGIHSGEVCGKPATLMLAREIASTPEHPLLKNLVIVFLPLLNADGNDRMSPDNRRGQVGPVQGMGTRRNAANLNINRDFTKLETEEGQAIAKVLREWNPAVAMDLHTTNGSQHRYTITYDGQRHPAGDAELTALVRERLLPDVGKTLLASTGYHSFVYGNFSNKNKEWISYPGLPRYSTHFLGLHNTIGLLSEAYSYASYKDRVMGTLAFVRHSFEWVADHAEVVSTTIAAAEKRTTDLGNNPGPNNRVALRHELKLTTKPITVLGYAAGSGPKKEIREHQNYELVCNDLVVTTHSVTRPWAYVIDSSQKAVIENLQRHGIQMQVLTESVDCEAEFYEFKSYELAGRPYEGHNVAKISVSPESAIWKGVEGDIIIRCGQPLGSLAAFLLEPESEDGLCTWNYFDAIGHSGEMYPVFRVMKPQEWKTKLLK
ncbi:MAG: M14 family metallopeptidase [Planctomycetes bacterium]|nr:M14 family metallopeptidase [Planctomycetota bacterium]